VRDATTARQLADGWNPAALKPTPNYALVRVITPDQRTKSGLILPDIKAAELGAAPTLRRWCGEVLAVGSAREWDGVRVGDVVTWGRYTNNELVRGDSTYMVMHWKDAESVIARELAGERQSPDVRGSWDPDGEEG
jgi:co-chaperonin GroES (HSP10)